MGRAQKGKQKHKQPKQKQPITAESYLKKNEGIKKSANKAPVSNDDDLLRKVFGKVGETSTSVRSSTSKKDRKKEKKKDSSSDAMALVGGKFMPFDFAFKKNKADTKIRREKKPSAISHVERKAGESFQSFKQRLHEATKKDLRGTSINMSAKKKQDKWKDHQKKKKEENRKKRETKEAEKAKDLAEKYKGMDIVGFGDVVEKPPENLDRFSSKFKRASEKSVALFEKFFT